MKQQKNKDVEKIREWQASPLPFIFDMWGLKPQPLKESYQQQFKELIDSISLENYDPDWSKQVKVDWFEDFEKGKNITWQQFLFFTAVELAIAGKAPRRITVESGHGTGKSSSLSMLIIWYLFCHKHAQIPCTAPSSDQMYDVLWKEIMVWIMKIRIQAFQELIEWTTTHIRMKEAPEVWFARAKTARKEAPEALAGIHGTYVMMVVDEASGVPEEIYKTAEGALTNEIILVVLMSNHTRLIGYYHASHTSDKQNWQCLRFNSEESPIVDWSYVERIATKHGKDSDEYRIRVLGMSPKEDAIDDRGYVPLLKETDLHFCDDIGTLRSPRLGVDPAGEGRDTTAWVARDKFRAKILAEEKKSTGKSIAQKTTTFVDYLDMHEHEVTVDMFGEGAKSVVELTWAKKDVWGVNVGEPALDTDRFLNLRAEAFWRLREWLRSGGELVRDDRWQELLNIRFKRNLRGKIQIMSKDEMRKEGIPSPNIADALMLTFCRTDNTTNLSNDESYPQDDGIALSDVY